MTKTSPKTLASSRDIPSTLVLSQSNVRRVKAGLSGSRSSLSRSPGAGSQSLHPCRGRCRGPRGPAYEVLAGGRRYRAPERLVKEKRLARTAPVRLHRLRAGRRSRSTSCRSPRTSSERRSIPLVQFRAFRAMRDKGMTEEAIAAAFFVGVAVVKQHRRRISQRSAQALRR